MAITTHFHAYVSISKWVEAWEYCFFEQNRHGLYDICMTLT